MCAILTKQITHILQLQARKKKRNKSAKDKKKILSRFIESLKIVAEENNVSKHSNGKTLKMKRYFFILFTLKIYPMLFVQI